MNVKRVGQGNPRRLWEQANRRAIYGFAKQTASQLHLSPRTVQEWMRRSSGKKSPGERLVDIVRVARQFKPESDAAAPLQLAAQLLGYELRPTKDDSSISLERADRAVAEMLKETGEAAHALLTSLEDGVVTREEAASVEKEIDEAILALNRARAMVRPTE